MNEPAQGFCNPTLCLHDASTKKDPKISYGILSPFVLVCPYPYPFQKSTHLDSKSYDLFA